MKNPDDTPQLTAPELYTGEDGRARFRERPLPLAEGTPMTRLSALAPSSGWQFRRSPVGFASDVHCTTAPQWLVVLQGQMEIGLPHDGSTRVFGPGEFFYLSHPDDHMVACETDAGGCDATLSSPASAYCS